MSQNIKAISIAKIVDEPSLLFFKCFAKGMEQALRSEMNLMLTRIQNRSIAPNERDKITTSNGCWSFTKDDKDITYIVLIQENYPERHTFSLIGDIVEELKKLLGYENSNESTITKHVNKFLAALVAKYENYSSFDLIYKAQTNVENIQLIMEDNLKKALDNNNQLETLDEKSYSMRKQAEKFKKDAVELRKMMYWRNVKLKIIIFLIVISILLYIIIPIASK